MIGNSLMKMILDFISKDCLHEVAENLHRIHHKGITFEAMCSLMANFL